LMLATGNPEFPRRVVCTGTKKISLDREITDTTHLITEFPSGLTLVIAGTTCNEFGLPDVLRGRKSRLEFSATSNKVELKPERIFSEEVDAEEFAHPQKIGDVPTLEKNWFDCIRSGATPFANIDLAIRAHVVLCLAEMSERLSLTLLFDDKTRTINTGEGKVVRPISYDTIIPMSA